MFKALHKHNIGGIMSELYTMLSKSIDVIVSLLRTVQLQQKTIILYSDAIQVNRAFIFVFIFTMLIISVSIVYLLKRT